MQISKTRLVVRIVLLLLIVLVVGLGYRAWAVRRPGHYFDQAQAALAAGNLPAARLNLQNCVERYPEHGPARFALAQVLVSEAQTQNPQVTYVHHPAAMQHLIAAGAAMLEDARVQRLLLENLLRSGRGDEAKVVAERLKRIEPQNALALIVVARSALETRRFSEAGESLDELAKFEHPFRFTVIFLRSELHRLESQDEARREAVAEAMTEVAVLDADALKQLGQQEQRALRTLLAQSVDVAADAEEAAAWLDAALIACGAFDDARGAVRLAQRLEARFPLGSLPPAAQSAREQRMQQVQAVAEQAIAQAVPVAADVDPDAADKDMRQRSFPEPIIYHFLADRQFAQGRPEQAMQTLQAGLKAAKEHPDAVAADVRRMQLLLASRMIVYGRASEAAPLLPALLEHDDTAGRAHMLSGGLALAERRYFDALAHFESAERTLGPTLDIKLALATTQIALEDWTAALAPLEEIVNKLPELTTEQEAWLARHLGDNNALRKAYVRALLAAGRTDDAEAQARALIGTPQDPEARTMLATHHWREGRRGRAIKLLTKAHVDYPSDLSILLGLSIATREHGYPMQAERLVARFVEEQPDELRRQLLGVQWQLWKGESAAALAEVQRLQADHDAPLLPLLEAQIQLRLGDLTATAELAAAMRDDIDLQLSSTLLKAEVAVRRGELDAIEELLEEEFAVEGLDEQGQPGAVGLARARLHNAGGDPRGAIAALVKILPYRGVGPRARAVLVEAVESLERMEGAEAVEQLLAEQLAAGPQQPILLFLHARYAMSLGNHTRALARIDELSVAEPDSPIPHFLRAQSFAQRGDHPSAQRHLAKATAADADYIPARLLAAQLWLADRKHDRAAEEAMAVLKLDPNRIDAALVGATAFARIDQTAQALELLRQVLAREPGHLEAAQFSADLYLARNQPQLALQVIRVARQTRVDDPSLATREIELLVRVDDIGQAHETAEAFLEQVDAASRFQTARDFAWLFLRLDRYEAARTWARQMADTGGAEQAAAVSWLLANIDLKQGEAEQNGPLLESAAEHLRSVLVRAPDHLGSQNNLAYLLARHLEQPAAALELVETMRQNLSESQLTPNLLDTMAMVYVEAGDSPRARQLLLSGIVRHPQAAALHFQLGIIHATAGEREPARQRLETALNLGLNEARRLKARQMLDVELAEQE